MRRRLTSRAQRKPYCRVQYDRGISAGSQPGARVEAPAYELPSLRRPGSSLCALSEFLVTSHPHSVFPVRVRRQFRQTGESI
jgi:hypothetical protein